MTLLLNKIFIDSFNYFNEKELTISDALKVTDILLLNLDIDTDDDKSYASYINNFIELNKLLINFLNLTEEESIYFNNEKITKLLSISKNNRVKNLTNFKTKRKEIYINYELKLVELIEELKNPEPLAA